MANAWFRMYGEFAHDPKVQMLSEAMQRRYVMLLCLRCSNTDVTDDVTLHDEEVAFQLRISSEEIAETKRLFIAKGFIDSSWNLLNWDKRQFTSDSSNARVAKHRALQKAKQSEGGNDDVTLQQRKSNAPDTDTDTDKSAKALSSSAKLPTCPVDRVIEVYHEVLPELPAVRLKTESRTRAIRKFWQWVLTSKKADSTRRAESSEQALAWLADYFGRVRDNDFLMGNTPKTGDHAGWKCDLDYLLTERGMKQVIEKTGAP